MTLSEGRWGQDDKVLYRSVATGDSKNMVCTRLVALCVDIHVYECSLLWGTCTLQETAPALLL